MQRSAPTTARTRLRYMMTTGHQPPHLTSSHLLRLRQLHPPFLSHPTSSLNRRSSTGKQIMQRSLKLLDLSTLPTPSPQTSHVPKAMKIHSSALTTARALLRYTMMTVPQLPPLISSHLSRLRQLHPPCLAHPNTPINSRPSTGNQLMQRPKILHLATLQHYQKYVPFLGE